MESVVFDVGEANRAVVRCGQVAVVVRFVVVHFDRRVVAADFALSANKKRRVEVRADLLAEEEGIVHRVCVLAMDVVCGEEHGLDGMRQINIYLTAH